MDGRCLGEALARDMMCQTGLIRLSLRNRLLSARNMGPQVSTRRFYYRVLDRDLAVLLEVGGILSLHPSQNVSKVLLYCKANDHENIYPRGIRYIQAILSRSKEPGEPE